MPKEKRAIGAKKTRERAASTFQALFSSGEKSRRQAILLLASGTLIVLLIIGALICALCWERLGANAAMLFGAAAIVVLRLLAAYYHWSLPKSDYHDEPQTPAVPKT